MKEVAHPKPDIFCAEETVGALDIQSSDEFSSEEEEEEYTRLEEENSSAISCTYHLGAETAVALEKTYILHMCGTGSCSPKIGVALSNHSCVVYDAENLRKVQTMLGHTDTVTGIKFSTSDENLLYSSSLEGTVKVWDIRVGGLSVKDLKDDTAGADGIKPLSCFDVAHNDRFACAGTPLVNSDVFLLFWDLRSSNLLGGYWESHTDDVTQVKFHPSKQDTLASGSVDGLINVFDIGESSEDDALLHSLNTESSVDKIGWLAEDDTDVLSCLTHTEDLQLWKLDDAAPYHRFSRELVARAIKKKCVNDTYLVDVLQTRPKEAMLLAGVRSGRGVCLQLLSICGGKLTTAGTLDGNKQIVRASWLHSESKVLATGGESGLLSLWQPGQSPESSTVNLKAPSKIKQKSHKKKPY